MSQYYYYVEDKDWTERYHDGVYQYTGKGKLLWIQRVCFWFLARLCPAFTTLEPTAKLQHIDTDDFDDAIDNACLHMLNKYRIKPAYVVLGYNQKPEFHAAISKGYRFELGRGIVNDGSLHPEYRTVTGRVKVVFVPWFDGVLVLPDLEKVRELV